MASSEDGKVRERGSHEIERGSHEVRKGDSHEVREGSAPNFCPPTQEGITLTFVDDNDDEVELEFLGLVMIDDRSYGFFFPIDEDNGPLSSGEVVVLEVTSLDEDGQPVEFELVDDEAIAQDAYAAFQEATKDLYRFE